MKTKYIETTAQDYADLRKPTAEQCALAGAAPLPEPTTIGEIVDSYITPCVLLGLLCGATYVFACLAGFLSATSGHLTSL